MDRHPYQGTPYHNPKRSVEYNTHDRRNARPSAAATSRPAPFALGVGPVIRSAAVASSNDPVARTSGAYAEEQ